MSLLYCTEENYLYNTAYEDENLFSFSPHLLSQYQQEIINRESALIYENCKNNIKNGIIPNSITEIETKETSRELEEELNQKEKELNEVDERHNLNNARKTKKIKSNKNKKNEKMKKMKCGRKTKLNNDKNVEHNKYSDDNLRRKCKHLVLKYTLKFINHQILIIYNGNIGNGIFKKELQTLNQSQKSDATINFNKMFLSRTLKEIFSQNISGRFTNFPPHHNRLLIEKLLNEKDEEKRIYFSSLFNLTFIQCLKHFRGEEKIDILEGLKCFDEIKDEIINNYEDDGIDYYTTLYYYLNHYEEIINNKKARKPRK